MSEPGPQGQPDEAMMDLLIKQVTDGLSPAEQRALDVLDSAVASAYLRDFERAAAAVTLAGSANAEPLPEALRTQLEQQAHAFMARTAVPDADGARFKSAPVPAAARRRAVSWAGGAGWFAAAACLVLALFGWLRSPQPPVTPKQVQLQLTIPPAVVAPVKAAPQPTAAEERAALLAMPESLRLTWGATKDPAAAGVSGDVVWDPVTQKGFLRFVGLAHNDPLAHQYQLWIFDGGRDKRYPVDGGVFDVPANASEVLVPIHAALPVYMVKAFAVTVEKPGGAVVSARDHVVVLAQAG